LAVPVKGAFTPGITFVVFTGGDGSGSGFSPHPIAKPAKIIAAINPSDLILVTIANSTIQNLIFLFQLYCIGKPAYDRRDVNHKGSTK
jgi:hypothetical protein